MSFSACHRGLLSPMFFLGVFPVVLLGSALFAQELPKEVFNTRYQHDESISRWQAPAPIATEVPMIDPIDHVHPMSDLQPSQYPVLPQKWVPLAPVTQGVMSTVPIDAPSASILRYQSPNVEVSPNVVLGTYVPPTEVPLGVVELGPAIGNDSALDPTRYPEGYDPAYPIEYPGASLETYYPVDGGVIARPRVETEAGTEAEIGVADNHDLTESLNQNEPPTIPSVVIESVESTSDEREAIGYARVDDMRDELESEVSQAESTSESAEEIVLPNSVGEQVTQKLEQEIKTLKQQLAAAELRAIEATEKAHAMARQASSQAEELKKTRKQLAQASNAVKRLEKQQRVTKTHLVETKKRLTAANATKKQQQKQLEQLKSRMVEKDRLVEKKQQKPSDVAPGHERPKALEQKSVVITESKNLVEAAQAKDKKAADRGDDNSNIAPPKNKGGASIEKPKSLREKVGALEAARDRQLTAAAKRIREEVEQKITTKLDAGKTEEHPEVKALRDSMTERLENSGEKIRRRYQRKINHLWKEAAARSRS